MVVPCLSGRVAIYLEVQLPKRLEFDKFTLLVNTEENLFIIK